MKKVIAFGGSNSKQSINKKLAAFAAGQIEHAEISILDLNDFELPIYSFDLENESGIPQNANKFLNEILSCDGIVLSLAEHNGAYSVAFKNIFDWMSRIDGKVWNNKPMLLMSTSPGGRGGSSVLEIAKNRFPYMGGNIMADFSLPFFSKNFSAEGIVDQGLREQFNSAIVTFKNAL